MDPAEFVPAPIRILWRKNDEDPVEYYLWDGAEWEGFGPAPFIVRTTPTTITEGGKVIDVPAGVYIRDGFIQNGTITNAKIGTAAIDNAKIVDATIETGKIAYLDAGKIQTGEFQSFEFENVAGKAGFRLAMNTRAIFNEGGEFTGEFEFLTNQEDIEFILRGSRDIQPALQLINGIVTINALNIRQQLKSQDWPTKGFLFDVETGVVQFKDDDGTITFSTNGYNGTAIQAALDSAIDDLNDEIDLQTPLTTFNSLLDTVIDVNTGLATKASLTALATTDGNITTVNEDLDTLNTSLDSIRDPNTGLLDSTKISVQIFGNDDQLLSDLQFLRENAPLSELDLFFNQVAFGQLIAGTLVADQAFVDTGNFDTVLANTVLANDGTIDNLKVNTLQIADEAVFVPVSGSTNQGQTLGTSWVQVAESSPISWADSGGKPKSVIVSGSMNFLGQISSADGGGCSIKVGVKYPSNAANFGPAVTTSTRIDYSQAVSTVSQIGLAAGGYTSVTVVLYAKTDRYGSSGPTGHTVGGGSVVGFAGKSGI